MPGSTSGAWGAVFSAICVKKKQRREKKCPLTSPLAQDPRAGRRQLPANSFQTRYPVSIAPCNVCESPEAHGDTRGSRSEGLSIGEHQ